MVEDQVVQALNDISDSLDRLGTNDPQMGAIEALALETSRVADAIGSVALALRKIADALS